jgi:hypothetical protein
MRSQTLKAGPGGSLVYLGAELKQEMRHISSFEL